MSISPSLFDLPASPHLGPGAAALAAAAAAGAFLVSCLGTRGLIPLLRRRALFDVPNERSSHAVPTVRGGGIAVIGALLLVWAGLGVAGRAPSWIGAMAPGAALVAAVSWIDDVRGVAPALRLCAQGVAVAVGLALLPAGGGMPPDWLGPAPALVAVGLLWLWFVNLFNFMDGIDGLAGSEAAAIGGGLALYAGIGAGVDPGLAALGAALLGAAAGFLVWNWSPARIFLGDVGSVTLGYGLGFVLLDLARSGHWQIALILPLYFLADATVTLVRRLLRGERIWLAHRQHFYQRAVQRGLSHAAVVRRVAAADLLLILCGWAAENGAGIGALAAAAAIVAALLPALARGR
ncbi:MAG TPA: glycosyltransferase family 4 protein [Stellaceae bacterium]|nr:glycosyltransferase family 4 protein [Stellaceae bacterium]